MMRWGYKVITTKTGRYAGSLVDNAGLETVMNTLGKGG